MRIFRKTIVAVTVCCLAASLFTGCHGKKNNVSFVIPEEFDTDRNYEINFWAKSDTNVNQTRIYENTISRFEELYPNIKVNLRLYTDYNRIYNDVITNISTDTTPNVCITYPDHIATYLTGTDVVVPLDELMTDENYGLGGKELRYDSVKKDEITESFLNECKIGDRYYALPYMRSTEACYINKDMVEKLGYEVPDVLTWDYIFEVSEAAMAKDGDGNYLVNGQNVLIPFIYKSTDNMLIQMLKQRNAGYSTDDGKIEIFNDTTKEILYELAEHGKTGAFSTFKISSYPANFLNAGQCIFAIDSTAGSTWMGADAPLSDISEDKIIDFETVVRPVPQYDVNNPSMISQGPSICIFNKSDRQEVLASWIFAQYLITNDVQIPYSETEGYVPVTKKAVNSDEYREYLELGGSDDNEHYSVKIEATKLLLDNEDNTFVTPVFNGSASLRNAAGQLIENVVKSVRRKETVDESYMDNLFDKMTALYHLDDISENSSQGALPTGSKVMLISIGAAWFIMGIVLVTRKIKKEKHCQ